MPCMANHAWESDSSDHFGAAAVEDYSSGHAWESEDSEQFGASDDESDVELRELGPGEELVSFCRELLWAKRLNAREYCIIMYWASLAGVKECDQYAKPQRRAVAILLGTCLITPISELMSTGTTQCQSRLIRRLT